MDCLCRVGLLLFAFVFVSALVGFLLTLRTGDASGWREYLSFERRFLFVLFLASFCEFIQGPYLYAVYADLHAQPPERIGLLFLSGGLANALTGCLLGPLSDACDKRANCAVFCVLSFGASFIAKTQYAPLPALFLGRVLGGAATASLESAFEALSVAEHRRRNLPEALLQRLFALSSACTGVSAVAAGFAASLAVFFGGVATPFSVASLVAVGCLLFLKVLFRRPRAAKRSSREAKAKKASLLQRLSAAPCEAVRVLCKKKEARLSAALQTAFELPLELFVFLWAQELEAGTDYGVAFAVLTASLCLGSFLFLAALRLNASLDCVIAGAFCGASLSFAVPCTSADSRLRFGSFLLFELCAGVLLPALGTLRSRTLPDDCRASATSLPRVVFNVALLAALGGGAASMATPAFTLGLCSLIGGAVLAFSGRALLAQTEAKKAQAGDGGACQQTTLP